MISSFGIQNFRFRIRIMGGDVDAFLENPRQKLEAAIAADERVEIR